MKHILVLACLVACLFLTTACDSPVSKLSSAIRSGWERLNGKSSTAPQPIYASEEEQAAASKLEPVPGEPLSEAEKIQIVKAQAFAAFIAKPESNTAVHLKEQAERAVELDKQYPQHQPIGKAAMEEVWATPFPEVIGGFKLKRKLVFPQATTTIEVMFPIASFRLHPAYFTAFAEFEGPKDMMRRFYVIDRGNFGGWARTAHWYYLRKGYVDPTKASQYAFVNTVQDGNRTWVVMKAKKGGRKLHITWWSDRYEVIVEGVGPDSLNLAVNTEWLGMN